MTTRPAERDQLLEAIQTLAVRANSLLHAGDEPSARKRELGFLETALQAAAELLMPAQTGESAFDYLVAMTDAARLVVQARGQGVVDDAADRALAEEVRRAESFLWNVRAHGG